MNNNFLYLLNQLKSNPISMLGNFRGVPMNGDPQQIVTYLMNSGQISQEQFNQARAFAQQMGYKF